MGDERRWFLYLWTSSFLEYFIYCFGYLMSWFWFSFGFVLNLI